MLFSGKTTSAAGGGGGEVLDDTGPLRHMSADVETDDHDEFVAELHHRLLEESMYQERLDSFGTWFNARNKLLSTLLIVIFFIFLDPSAHLRCKACKSEGAGADCNTLPKRRAE